MLLFPLKRCLIISSSFWAQPTEFQDFDTWTEELHRPYSLCLIAVTQPRSEQGPLPGEQPPAALQRPHVLRQPCSPPRISLLAQTQSSPPRCSFVRDGVFFSLFSPPLFQNNDSCVKLTQQNVLLCSVLTPCFKLVKLFPQHLWIWEQMISFLLLIPAGPTCCSQHQGASWSWGPLSTAWPKSGDALGDWSWEVPPASSPSGRHILNPKKQPTEVTRVGDRVAFKNHAWASTPGQMGGVTSLDHLILNVFWFFWLWVTFFVCVIGWFLRQTFMWHLLCILSSWK